MVDINVDNTKGVSLESLSARVAKAKDSERVKISICNCGISSLDGLKASKTTTGKSDGNDSTDAKAQPLPFILLAADNRISSLEPLPGCLPDLTSLDIANNKISALADLAPLKQLAHLRHLNLEFNKIASLPNYRETVLDRDGVDVSPDSEEEDDEDEDDDEEDEYEDDEDDEGGEDGEEPDEGTGAEESDAEDQADEDEEDDGEGDEDSDADADATKNKRKRAADASGETATRKK
ncbi:hypothetical protein HDU81_008776 [Chytriomyces hyalinus]|nr:hypothetical protein HDU81_008776 [Chytriomyces hyalinus]